MPDDDTTTFEPGERGPDGYLVCSCRHRATAHGDPSRDRDVGCKIEGCGCAGYDAGSLACANPACGHSSAEHIYGDGPTATARCTIEGCPCGGFVRPASPGEAEDDPHDAEKRVMGVGRHFVGGVPDPVPDDLEMTTEQVPVRGRGDIPPSIVQLVFEACGAATGPLLEDHPDYVFPNERVQAAIERVLAEWVPDDGEFGRDIKRRPTVEIEPSQITRVQTRSGTWHSSGYDPDYERKGPDPRIETMGIWIDPEGSTREAIGVGPVLVLGGPNGQSRVAISFDDIAAIQYREES